MKVEQSAIMPEVQVDLWAMVTLMNFSMKGYTRVSMG